MTSRTPPRTKPKLDFTSRQVNLTLELLLIVSLVSGVVSWIVDIRWAGAVTTVHTISGFALVILSPLKGKGPVRSGLRRRKWTRWISLIFAIFVLGTIGLGTLHSTGLWFGIGHWSALWTHLLLGFGLVPFALWHVFARRVRPTRADADRRYFMSAGAVAALATAATVTQELTLKATNLEGSTRAGTGSHDIASFDPSELPIVSWIDDRTPDAAARTNTILVDGQKLDIRDLHERTINLQAVLDCTGGWRSKQRWDVVPLSALVDTQLRSYRVTSSTGYSRLFSRSDADHVYVCTGYDGIPLSPGHGAPLRIVAPGRRGPWWVKWISSIETTNQPAWLQLPFPAT